MHFYFTNQMFMNGNKNVPRPCIPFQVHNDNIRIFEKDLVKLVLLEYCLSMVRIAWALAGNEESGWHQPRLILMYTT